MTHSSLHCVSSTVKTPFHAKYFQASMQQTQGCSTGGKEPGAEGDLSAITSLGVSHLMGWAEQVLPTGTGSPTQGKGDSTHPFRVPVWTSRSQGQRKEWKQHCDVGWETWYLQCKSEAHPRDGDRDSPGDKAWNRAPESLGRKRVGDDWSQQLSIGALRALTWAEKLQTWRACSLIENEKYGWYWEKQQDDLANAFPILCSLRQTRAVREYRLQEGCSSLCLTSQL